MRSIKEIAIELFGITDEKPSQSGGEHIVALNCEVDRSQYPDQLPDDFENLNKYIDHTILKPTATKEDVIKVCKEAEKYKFRSVCVNPVYVGLAKENLPSVDVCSVIGFPLGANTTAIKAAEAKIAIEQGAREIDIVIAIGSLIGGDYDDVYDDILTVCKTVHANGAILKVIIETSLLNYEEKVIACLLAKKAGADFVKTSTGFSGGGAEVEDIKLMRSVVGPKMGVKASGGIRTREKAIAMLKAGANRIGASSSLKIIGAELNEG